MGGVPKQLGRVPAKSKSKTVRRDPKRRMRPQQDILSLPFDQYQRYRLVADLVGQVRKQGERLSILDVGGRSGLLRRFLPEDDVVLVDLESSDEAGLLLGDGARLPVQDSSFDVVTACDTLEHVPPAQRGSFVRECARVSRRWAMIAGPFQHPRVEEAEKILTRFLEEKLGIHHRYLAEHRTHGLPDRGVVEATLIEGGAHETTAVGHGNLERWLALMFLSMYMDRDAPLRKLAGTVNRFYNQALFACDQRPPVYRHVVVASFEDVPMPSADWLEGSSAPAGSLEPFTKLIAELTAFDRERDVFEAERTRLIKVNDGLLLDLDCHRDTLGKAEVDLSSHRVDRQCLLEIYDKLQHESEEERDELQRDLKEHTESLAEIRREIESYQADRTQMLAEYKQLQSESEMERGELQKDLEEHTESLAQVTREIESQRIDREHMLAELEKLQRESQLERSAFEHDLEEHRGSLEEIEREIESHRADRLQMLAELEKTQAESEQEKAELEQDLQEHRSSLQELEGEIESHRSDREKMLEDLAALRSESEQERDALEKDLQQHDQALITARQDLEGHRESLQVIGKDRDEKGKTLETLELDLKEHRATLEAMREELRLERAAAAELGAELELAHGLANASNAELIESDRELAQARAELRSRLECLKGVLRLKKRSFRQREKSGADQS